MRRAYRGLAYVVFERLPIEQFGNRIPQFSFEVVRGLSGVAGMVRSVCLIPAATEFGYDPAGVMQVIGPGTTKPDNRHQFQARSDVIASLDALQALCPNLTGVSVVVSWFGDDLRVGQCRIAPRVEISQKQTEGGEWSVAGLTRSQADLVSLSNGVARLWGHAVGCQCDRADRASEGPRALGHAVSVHHDGHSRRQRSPEPLYRCKRATDLSLARAHHL